MNRALLRQESNGALEQVVAIEGWADQAEAHSTPTLEHFGRRSEIPWRSHPR